MKLAVLICLLVLARIGTAQFTLNEEFEWLCASPLARMVRQRQALENEISIIQKRLDTPRDASTVSFQELSELVERRQAIDAVHRVVLSAQGVMKEDDSRTTSRLFQSLLDTEYKDIAWCGQAVVDLMQGNFQAAARSLFHIRSDDSRIEGTAVGFAALMMDWELCKDSMTRHPAGVDIADPYVCEAVRSCESVFAPSAEPRTCVRPELWLTSFMELHNHLRPYLNGFEVNPSGAVTIEAVAQELSASSKWELAFLGRLLRGEKLESPRVFEDSSTCSGTNFSLNPLEFIKCVYSSESNPRIGADSRSILSLLSEVYSVLANSSTTSGNKATSLLVKIFIEIDRRFRGLTSLEAARISPLWNTSSPLFLDTRAKVITSLAEHSQSWKGHAMFMGQSWLLAIIVDAPEFFGPLVAASATNTTTLAHQPTWPNNRNNLIASAHQVVQGSDAGEALSVESWQARRHLRALNCSVAEALPDVFGGLCRRRRYYVEVLALSLFQQHREVEAAFILLQEAAFSPSQWLKELPASEVPPILKKLASLTAPEFQSGKLTYRLMPPEQCYTYADEEVRVGPVLFLVQLLLSKRMIEEAIFFLSQLSNSPQQSAPVYKALGYCYTLKGRSYFQHAIDAYETAARLKPFDAGALDALGYLHWVQGEYQASIAAWDSAASMHPNNVAVLYRLGQAYAVTQRWAEAAATLQRAAQLNASCISCIAAVGEILFATEQYQKAELFLSHATRHGSPPIFLFCMLGDARLRLNQTLTALVSYRHFAHSALLGDMQYARQHREFAAACLNNAAVAALHSGLRYHGDAVTWLKAAAQLSEDDGNSLTLQRNLEKTVVVGIAKAEDLSDSPCTDLDASPQDGDCSNAESDATAEDEAALNEEASWGDIFMDTLEYLSSLVRPSIDADTATSGQTNSSDQQLFAFDSIQTEVDWIQTLNVWWEDFQLMYPDEAEAQRMSMLLPDSADPIGYHWQPAALEWNGQEASFLSPAPASQAAASARQPFAGTITCSTSTPCDILEAHFSLARHCAPSQLAIAWLRRGDELSTANPSIAEQCYRSATIAALHAMKSNILEEPMWMELSGLVNDYTFSNGGHWQEFTQSVALSHPSVQAQPPNQRLSVSIEGASAKRLQPTAEPKSAWASVAASSSLKLAKQLLKTGHAEQAAAAGVAAAHLTSWVGPTHLEAHLVVATAYGSMMRDTFRSIGLWQSEAAAAALRAPAHTPQSLVSTLPSVIDNAAGFRLDGIDIESILGKLFAEDIFRQLHRDPSDANKALASPLFQQNPAFWLLQAAQGHPNSWMAQARAGGSLYRMQQYAAAVPLLERALMLNPQLMPVRHMLACAYALLHVEGARVTNQFQAVLNHLEASMDGLRRYRLQEWNTFGDDYPWYHASRTCDSPLHLLHIVTLVTTCSISATIEGIPCMQASTASLADVSAQPGDLHLSEDQSREVVLTSIEIHKALITSDVAFFNELYGDYRKAEHYYRMALELEPKSFLFDSSREWRRSYTSLGLPPYDYFFATHLKLSRVLIHNGLPVGAAITLRHALEVSKTQMSWLGMAWLGDIAWGRLLAADSRRFHHAAFNRDHELLVEMVTSYEEATAAPSRMLAYRQLVGWHDAMVSEAQDPSGSASASSTFLSLSSAMPEWWKAVYKGRLAIGMCAEGRYRPAVQQWRQSLASLESTLAVDAKEGSHALCHVLLDMAVGKRRCSCLDQSLARHVASSVLASCHAVHATPRSGESPVRSSLPFLDWSTLPEISLRSIPDPSRKPSPAFAQAPPAATLQLLEAVISDIMLCVSPSGNSVHQISRTALDIIAHKNHRDVAEHSIESVQGGLPLEQQSERRALGLAVMQNLQEKAPAPCTSWFAFVKGRVAEGLGLFQEAERYLHEASFSSGAYPSAKLHLARLLLGMGRANAVAELLHPIAVDSQAASAPPTPSNTHEEDARLELPLRTPCFRHLHMAASILLGYSHALHDAIPGWSLQEGIRIMRSAVTANPHDPFGHAGLADLLSWGRGVGHNLPLLSLGIVAASNGDTVAPTGAFNTRIQQGKLTTALDHYQKAQSLLSFAKSAEKVAAAARALGGSGVGVGAGDIWHGGWLGLCSCCLCDCGTCAEMDTKTWPPSLWRADGRHGSTPSGLQGSVLLQGDAIGLYMRVSFRIGWLLVMTGDTLNSKLQFDYIQRHVLEPDFMAGAGLNPTHDECERQERSLLQAEAELGSAVSEWLDAQATRSPEAELVALQQAAQAAYQRFVTLLHSGSGHARPCQWSSVLSVLEKELEALMHWARLPIPYGAKPISPSRTVP